MEVLTLQIFVSLGLVVGSLLLFAFTCRQRTFEHADRLALLPIESDEPRDARPDDLRDATNQPSGPDPDTK